MTSRIAHRSGGRTTGWRDVGPAIGQAGICHVTVKGPESAMAVRAEESVPKAPVLSEATELIDYAPFQLADVCRWHAIRHSDRRIGDGLSCIPFEVVVGYRSDDDSIRGSRALSNSKIIYGTAFRDGLDGSGIRDPD
ncbi:hypothetical protein [Streptomyces sp. cg2]|uniref:hypothetical protein n=1 Tax=Streptomyces sp. cg2 TaxID=3238799 RepID=UPI0034E28F85